MRVWNRSNMDKCLSLNTECDYMYDGGRGGGKSYRNVLSIS